MASVRLRGARCLSEPFMLRAELLRELAAPAEDVAPRFVHDIQLLPVEGFHPLYFADRSITNSACTEMGCSE